MIDANEAGEGKHRGDGRPVDGEGDTSLQLKELRKFTDENYSLAAELAEVDEIRYIGPDNGAKLKVLIKTIRAVADFKFFKVGYFDSLRSDFLIGKFVGHDLDNLAVKLMPFLQYLAANTADLDLSLADDDFFADFAGKKKNLNRLVSFFRQVVGAWPQYCLIIEDILLRKTEAEGRQVEKADLDPEFLERALKSLFDSQAVDGRVKFLVEEAPKIKSLLKADEVILTQPGLVADVLFNIIRNSAKEKVAGKRVKIIAEREGKELVLQVVDSGIGMTPAQLDPHSEECIFKEGVSGTKSTGLGLAEADIRLPSLAGAKLSYWSKKRGTGSGYSSFSTDEKTEIPFTTYHSEKDSSDYEVSTLAEIRLSITKKTA